MRQTEPILPCERLLFHSDLVKIGRFHCDADSRWFASTVPVHNHVLVITRRPVWWRRAEGHYRFAESGAALFHRPGGEIQRRSVGGQGDFSDWFGIRENEFIEILERHRLKHRELTGESATLVTNLASRLQENRLITSLLAAPADVLAVEEGTLHLLGGICAQFSARASQTIRADTQRRRRRLADRARLWLDGSVREEITDSAKMSLADLASALGVSVYHLCRLFKSETGLTLNDYRQRQRVGYALELMQQSRQDLTTLAHRLGFSSHSHFSRVFKSQTGLPPSLLNGA